MVKNLEYMDRLDRLEDLFEGFFQWLARQYDDHTGGFYYARSSIHDKRFVPDIESTAQALNIITRNQMLESMPQKMKEKMIGFFRSKQDPETGYFFDENPAMKKDEVMVHRAISYSTGALKILGSTPLYPLPLKTLAAPDYVKTPSDYLEKWKSIDLSNSWRGCDLLASSCVYIAQMEKEKQAPFLKEAVQFLKSIQDPETGLWGEGSLYVRISGTFKLHTFYSRFNIPMPNTDRIYQTILHCLRHEEASDMCYIRNPIDLLVYANLSISPKELVEIMDITIDNMARLKRKDGAFSREIESSPPAPNVAQVKKGEVYPSMPEPVYLSNGLYEGDMNASTQTTLIRQQLYKLTGVPIVPLRESTEFYQLL
ncbi:prenyltransferase/squalene oxidase repeat-containing protein [Litchfieldia salsa]|uniref:Uncharacterized protein n=1 Tax=Litchfieldia salsa TaxID=930152 RepID=A0A1H0PSK6_9BACI|nr:hypothetical protein [Litchfieldia salsa]SDP07645.1 hypothetical protein SAMN05216565_101436 [Litchfieldia salsa]